MSADMSVPRGCISVYECTYSEGGLTGAAIYYEARRVQPSGTVATSDGAEIVKTSADDIQISTDTVFYMFFYKADTRALKPGDLYHEWKIVPAGQTEPRSMESGKLTIRQDTVRAV
jgi:hypothetical protein